MWNVNATAASEMKGVSTSAEFNEALIKAEARIGKYPAWPAIKAQMELIWLPISRKIKIEIIISNNHLSKLANIIQQA